MAVGLGGGKYSFMVRDTWAKLPDEIFWANIAATVVGLPMLRPTP
jgi:hypothetical protein